MEAKDYVTALLGMGLTQAYISKETGVNQSTISKIVNGVVDDVTSKNYRALEALYIKHTLPRRVKK